MKMLVENVVKELSTNRSAFGKALGIHPSAVPRWKDGVIPPKHHAKVRQLLAEGGLPKELKEKTRAPKKKEISFVEVKQQPKKKAKHIVIITDDLESIRELL